MARWIYVPVEVKVREFHAKLLFAKMAAAQGYNVVIGRKAEIMNAALWLPAGAFLGMWVQLNFYPFFKKLKSIGFFNIGMDEEGLVTFSDEMYERFKISKETLSCIDMFVAWGEKQKNIIQNYMPKNKISVAGNLRFDVLRPDMQRILEDEKKDLQRKYGRFILIVSSFGLANHCDGLDSYMKDLRKSQVVRDDRDEDFLRKYALLQTKVCNSLKESVLCLSQNFPDIAFIVRPHPGESLDAWASLKDIQNVVICNIGNIHGWIVASECVIHHFCTTAIESFVAGKPSIAYRPFTDLGMESSVPYEGSLEARDSDELIDLIKTALSGGHEKWDEKRKMATPFLKFHLDNINGEYCFKKILDAINSNVMDVKDSSLKVIFYFIKQNILDSLKIIKRLILVRKKSYIDLKFSSMKTSEVKKILNDIPCDVDLDVMRLSNMCFLIRSKQ